MKTPLYQRKVTIETVIKDTLAKLHAHYQYTVYLLTTLATVFAMVIAFETKGRGAAVSLFVIALSSIVALVVHTFRDPCHCKRCLQK